MLALQVHTLSLRGLSARTTNTQLTIKWHFDHRDSIGPVHQLCVHHWVLELHQQVLPQSSGGVSKSVCNISKARYE